MKRIQTNNPSELTYMPVPALFYVVIVFATIIAATLIVLGGFDGI